MQECSFCHKQVYKLLAKGLCAACYQRQYKHGSPDYVKVRKPCTVDGCGELSVAQGLCEKHYRRLKRRGVVEAERFDKWGHSEAHPLYQSYVWMRRKRTDVCPEWSDFWQFVRDVGERPSNKHKFMRVDDSKPYGPGNVAWMEPKTDVPAVTLADRAEWMRAYRIGNERKFKCSDLRKMHGITIEQYEEMERQQGGVCAICGQKERAVNPKTGEARGLAVDHCHSGNHIRGLLCSSCNTGLGLFQDDVDRLRKAIDYLTS
jgi:hypothetical protein